MVAFKYHAFCRRMFYSASKHISPLYCFDKEQIRNLWSVYVIFKLHRSVVATQFFITKWASSLADWSGLAACTCYTGVALKRLRKRRSIWRSKCHFPTVSSTHWRLNISSSSSFITMTFAFLCMLLVCSIHGRNSAELKLLMRCPNGVGSQLCRVCHREG